MKKGQTLGHPHDDGSREARTQGRHRGCYHPAGSFAARRFGVSRSPARRPFRDARAPYVGSARSLSRSAGGVSLLRGVLASAHPRSARHDAFDRENYGGWGETDTLRITIVIAIDHRRRPAHRCHASTGRAVCVVKR